jgi:hypothetical protein
VSRTGEVAPNHYLKWKEGETWVVLVGGDVKGLPPARDIAEARLIVPVIRSHAKAPTRLAATLLTEPFARDRPFDFRHLGDLAGTVVVPRQPGEADYRPPQTFPIDVTSAVKRIAAGDAEFRGFGLRVVQDRSVDDGYIVRVDLPAAARVILEIDVFDRK